MGFIQAFLESFTHLSAMRLVGSLEPDYVVGLGEAKENE
jgi:hypothetical protein